MEKIFVIGSNSFSGSAFVRHALLNNFEVIGVSRSAESNSVFLPHRWLDAKQFQHYQFYQKDLNQKMNFLCQDLK